MQMGKVATTGGLIAALGFAAAAEAEKNRGEALAILADVTKLPKENVAFAFSKDDFYHSPDTRPDVASVQKEIDASAEMRVIPKRIEISPRYVDLSLIEEAKRRIDGE